MASALHPRLPRTAENARAIGVERVFPLVREPSRRQAGIRFGEQLVAATIMARRHLEVRRKREGVARSASHRRVWS
jgi:hypothetical protein